MGGGEGGREGSDSIAIQGYSYFTWNFNLNYIFNKDRQVVMNLVSILPNFPNHLTK